MIAIYFDDGTIIMNKKKTSTIKALLNKRFDMKDLGPIRSVLSIELIYDRQKGTLLLQQLGYIHTTVKDYNLQDAKPTYIPMATDLNYRTLIG